MYDKLDLRIPWQSKYVLSLQSDVTGLSGLIPDPCIYNWPFSEKITFTDGKKTYTGNYDYHAWDKISSDISDVAIGFFPEGNGFDKPPHIRIKASPAKILQGHNVFGPDTLKEGALQMLAHLQAAFPLLYSHLDIKRSEIKVIDATYSAHIERLDYRETVLRLFSRLFPNGAGFCKREGYVAANTNSQYIRHKAYFKVKELIAKYKQALKCGETEKAKILGDPRLISFAEDLLRFEATFLQRGLQFHGIPVMLHDFFKFESWFNSTHKVSVSQHLWELAFDRIFKKFEGDTMSTLNDDEIKLKIEKKHITYNKNGNPSFRRSNAVFKTYIDIKREGYQKLSRIDNTTFRRNVKLLIEAGISEALLRSIEPLDKTTNVVPILDVIKVDFSRQKPDWYEEPKASFSDRRRHLKLVG